MKPARAPQAAPETPVRVEFKVQFAGGPKGRHQAPVTRPTASPEQESVATSMGSPAMEPVKKASPSQVPKVTRLLVLAHHFESLVRQGVVKDYAEIARLTGLSRARVTQITALSLLSPNIQQMILEAPESLDGMGGVVERDLRAVVANAAWSAQRKAWASLTRRGSVCRRVGAPISSSRLSGLLPKHLNNGT